MTKKIQLTQGKFSLVDDADFEWINQWKWFAQKIYGKFYAARHEGNKYIYMHRVILGTEKNMKTDHRDGNGLNNQRNNLRSASHIQNMMNRGANKNNKLGVKGVSISKGKYRAEIKVNGKTTILGMFDDCKSASVAYDKAATELYGEFAGVNKIK